jgi:hypothetical protein
MRFSLWLAVCLAAAAQENPFYSAGLIFPFEKWQNHASSIIELHNAEQLAIWYHPAADRGGAAPAARRSGLVAASYCRGHARLPGRQPCDVDRLRIISLDALAGDSGEQMADRVVEAQDLARRSGPGRDDSLHRSYSCFVRGGLAINHARFNAAWIRQGDPQ